MVTKYQIYIAFAMGLVFARGVQDFGTGGWRTYIGLIAMIISLIVFFKLKK